MSEILQQGDLRELDIIIAGSGAHINLAYIDEMPYIGRLLRANYIVPVSLSGFGLLVEATDAGRKAAK